MCSDNYATLFYPDLTDFEIPSFRIKIMWALPVIMNDTTTDLTSPLIDIELNQTIMESP